MLVYSHCPVQAQWQLLQTAVSRSEFDAFPLVKSFFFVAGMRFLQQNHGVLPTRRGIATVTLGFTQPTTFTFRLTYGHSALETIQVSTSEVTPAVASLGLVSPGAATEVVTPIFS